MNVKNEEDFKRLIKRGKFQFFVFVSKINLPFSFAVHSWIVTNYRGKINRWEVWQSKNNCKSSWDHVHLNLMEPWKGINVFPFFNNPRWSSKLVGKVEGSKGSLAEKLCKFVNNKSKDYLMKDHYHFFPGPNSNTFVQWILDNFPECDISLNWRAIGKNYKLN